MVQANSWLSLKITKRDIFLVPVTCYVKHLFKTAFYVDQKYFFKRYISGFYSILKCSWVVNFRSRRYSREINFIIVVNIVVTRFRIGLFGVELRAFYCSQLSQLYIYLILPQNLTELGEQPTLHPRPRTHDFVTSTHDPRPTTISHSP